MDDIPPTLSEADVRIIGKFADHPNLRKVARAIISVAQRMEAQSRFLQTLRGTIPGITPGEFHDCGAYFWQGEPFIAITKDQGLAYRVAEDVEALPLPHHQELWTPERHPVAKWRVLSGDVDFIKRDWMPAALRALEVVKRELGDASLVSHQADTAI